MKREEIAHIEKIDSNGKVSNYGLNIIGEVIPESYKWNGFFWENPKTKTIYTTTKLNK